jgi:hypothetical protein
MKHFTLDVKLWRCGNSQKADSESLGGGQTLLYHPEYTVHCMCVMGQMLWQAGALPEDLARLAGPDTYQQFMIDRHGGDSWGTPELHDLLRSLVTVNRATPPGLTRSRFARDLEVINDDVFAWCSVAERIGRLRQRLLAEGIEMSLANYGDLQTRHV